MKNIKKYLILATLIPVFVLSLGAIAKADNDNENRGRGNGNNGGQNNGDDDRRRSTGSTLEVHINNDGKVLARGGKVTAVSGNAITATLTFGSNVMTWTINTNDSTKFVRKNGGASNVSEVSVGDFISWQGKLDTTVTGLTVTASIVKDWSVQINRNSISGTVANVDATAKSFVLTTSSLGNVTVTTTASTVLKKGDSVVTFADIHVGDRIDKAEGLYNSVGNTLAATMVKIHSDSGSSSEAQVYEGTLQSVAGTTLPTSFVMKKNNTEYTVNVPVGISILGKNWLVIPFTNLQVGDRVRVYGTLTDTTIDASVVRDTDR